MAFLALATEIGLRKSGGLIQRMMMSLYGSRGSSPRPKRACRKILLSLLAAYRFCTKASRPARSKAANLVLTSPQLGVDLVVFFVAIALLLAAIRCTVTGNLLQYALEIDAVFLKFVFGVGLGDFRSDLAGAGSSLSAKSLFRCSFIVCTLTSYSTPSIFRVSQMLASAYTTSTPPLPRPVASMMSKGARGEISPDVGLPADRALPALPM